MFTKVCIGVVAMVAGVTFFALKTGSCHFGCNYSRGYRYNTIANNHGN